MALQVWLPLNGNFNNQGLCPLSEAIVQNSVTWTPGKLGNNPNFAATATNYVTCSALQNKDNNFSICFWIKSNSGATFTQWADVFNANNFRLEFNNTSGKTLNLFGFGYDSSGLGTITINNDEWHHVAYVFKDGAFSAYLDGVYVKQRAVQTAGTKWSGKFRLGDTAKSYFQLADFRVYDEALSSRQVHDISLCLAVHYPMHNILAAGIAKDCSGYGYDGLLKGCTTYNSTVYHTNHYRFASSGNCALYGLTSPLNANTPNFTIMCYVYFQGAQTGAIYNLRTATGVGISVFHIHSGSSENFRLDDGNLQSTFSNYQIPLNTWLHMVITRDTTSKKLYINGELIQTIEAVGDLSGIGTLASIGQSSTNTASSSGNNLNGSMFDFRIYMNALSADEIKRIYNIKASIDNYGNMIAYEFNEED